MCAQKYIRYNLEIKLFLSYSNEESEYLTRFENLSILFPSATLSLSLKLSQNRNETSERIIFVELKWEEKLELNEENIDSWKMIINSIRPLGKFV